MKKEQPKKRRQFLGKLDGFTNPDGTINKIERNFQNKHLKAYLRGDEYFTFGKDQKTREPQYFKTLYTWV
jgi:hypothetical protein